MSLTIKLLIIACFSSILLVACKGGKMVEKASQFPTVKDVPISSWKKLSEKKIIFGHQSVGYNIIDGIRDLMKEHPQIKLNIVETADKSDFKEGLFAHVGVGKNREPESKTHTFARLMEGGIGGKADIAFFKFCYVDANDRTDIQKLFRDYESTLFRLREAYPETIFIHVTMPLTSIQIGPKAWVKKILGRQIRGIDDNIKRNQFNDMLRKEGEGKAPIFDLAKIESTFPDGTRSLLRKNGEVIYSLVPDYTHDGGHLNPFGRKIIAEQLLVFLAQLIE